MINEKKLTITEKALVSGLFRDAQKLSVNGAVIVWTDQSL